MTHIIAKSSHKNPCVGCGACCAYFRVSFHWSECKSSHGNVDDDKTSQVTPHRVAMKGTEGKNPRCVNLSGTVGVDSSCSDYTSRPTPCRDFDASYEKNIQSEGCDKARISHGLTPLTISDWQ